MELIKLNINDRDYEIPVKKNWTLMYVIREVLQLTGTKCGCNTGDCGACKVLIDGEAKNSCTILAVKSVDKKIKTIESLIQGTKLHPIQEAFVETGAIQCGYCTPGMIISAKGLLDKNLNPKKEDIVAAIDNNLCRCTGYVKIIDAIDLAARRMRGEA